MRMVVRSEDKHTWLICETKDEYENFLQTLTHPHFPEGCDQAAIASYTEYAEMLADNFRMAHHIPLLKWESPLAKHVFIDYGIETDTLSVLEEGYDEYAVQIWSELLRQQSFGLN